MTQSRVLDAIVSAAASIFLLSSVCAAEGIKAGFTAIRKLPVDQITVAFDQVDIYGPDDPTERPDPGRVMMEAFKAAGLQVVAYRTYMAGLQPGANTAMFNKVTSGSKAPGGYEFKRSHTFTLAGFRQPEAVLHILARNGIRHTQLFRMENSNLEAVRSELANEAIDGALLKARALAKRLGIQDTDIVDVTVAVAGTGTVSFGTTTVFGSASIGARGVDFGAMQSMDTSVELSSLEAAEPVVRVSVPAVVTLSPKRSAP